MHIKFSAELFNPVYAPYFLCRKRYLILYGGTGSGKSIFAAQKLILRCLYERGHLFLLVRKVARTIRESQFMELKRIIAEWGISSLFDITEHNMNITCIATGSRMLAAGLDDVNKLKSISRPSGMWIEEATELSESDFNQLDLRMRGATTSYKQIMLTYNPINPRHWLKKRFHDKPSRLGNDGRGRLTERTAILKTTFRDNVFIDTEEYAATLEENAHNKSFYSVNALGEWASPEHIIYSKWVIEDEFPNLQSEISYGLDFGFNVATAFVRNQFDGPHDVYTKELIYRTHMTNGELIAEFKRLNVSHNDLIHADGAEPQRIEEIYQAGYNIVAANKAVGAGIDYVQRKTLHIHRDSTNLIGEIQGYQWKIDRNGEPLDEPIKWNDHAMDAMRYDIFTFGSKYIVDLPTDAPIITAGSGKRFSPITKGFTNRY